MSVVARPPVKLLMTCSLNACRSASWFDVCSSAAPVRRRRSASQPLSSAMARNPKMFRKTMKSATRSCGRESAPTTTGSAGVPKYCALASPAYITELSTPTIMPVRCDWIVLAAMIGRV